MNLKIIVGEAELPVTLSDNPTSREFVSLLPLRLTLEDFAGKEKISDLPKKLTSAEAAVGAKPLIGDIAYYAPWGNLALFYNEASFANGLIILGKINLDSQLLNNSNSQQIEIIKA